MVRIILQPLCRAILLGFVGLVVSAPCWRGPCWGADHWTMTRAASGHAWDIQLQGRPFATYHEQDQTIPRPFLANFVTPHGAKITRNHPPTANDLQDHATFHPGVWMAFGDLSGADSWRLKAPVEMVAMVESPRVENGVLMFAVENRYWQADRQREVCREIVHYRWHELPQGVLLDWDSTFQSDQSDFTFGDQEEMGLGVRLDTPFAVSSGRGGRIINSQGDVNEKGLAGRPGVWGKQANWCDYSGQIGDEFVGILVVPHPSNLRRCWCHARDTGFMALNPFGIAAFTRQPKREAVVKLGTPFRLRYGILFHWHRTDREFDPAMEAQHCLTIQNQLAP